MKPFVTVCLAVVLTAVAMPAAATVPQAGSPQVQQEVDLLIMEAMNLFTELRICERMRDGIKPPSGDDPEEWAKYKKDVEPLEKCIAQTGAKLKAILAKLLPLGPKLPPAPVGPNVASPARKVHEDFKKCEDQIAAITRAHEELLASLQALKTAMDNYEKRRKKQ